MLNDDGNLSIDNAISVKEGNAGTTNAVFTVTLSPASNQTATVNFATADFIARAGSDYVANSGTFTFNPGETIKNITVLNNGDTEVESEDTFLANLSNPVNAVINAGNSVCSILNDDEIRISINYVTVTEGKALTTSAVFTVTLSPVSNQTVTVNFATSDGNATAGSDYQSKSGVLTLSAGTISQ